MPDAAAQSAASTSLVWGSNSAGQLGYPNPGSDLIAHLVAGLGPGNAAIAAGDTHSLVITSNGTVLAWGNNAAGQLGDGTTTPKLTPVPVRGLGPGSGVVAGAAGSAHSLALKSDGTVLAWGSNANGQLGDGTTTNQLSPVQVNGLGPGSGVVAIRAGGAQSLALKSDGTVLVWGANANGQLGDGTTTQKTTPVQVTGLGPGSEIVAVGAGNGHSLAVKSDGTVLAWGINATGQLGDGTTTQRTTPVQVSGLGSGSGVISIAPGNGQSLALKSDGTVLAWGRNPTGQLGDGTTTQRTTPVPVVGLGPGSGVVAIAAANAAGALHSLALKSDGTVLAWGDAATGQLGDGTTTRRTTPFQVSGLGPGSGVVAIAAGTSHSLALKSDGTVLAWGSNANGQLGDRTLETRLVPVQAGGLGPGSGVFAIAAGSNHSLALKN